jgi:hypothetical protein
MIVRQQMKEELLEPETHKEKNGDPTIRSGMPLVVEWMNEWMNECMNDRYKQIKEGICERRE